MLTHLRVPTYLPTQVRTVQLRSLRLLRAESARVEKDHAAACAFGRSGVGASVQAIAAAASTDEEESVRLARTMLALPRI